MTFSKVIDNPEVAAVDKSGILHNELASIPSDKWEEVREDTLRFAYYLAKTAVTDDIAVDTLTITGDMNGAWKKAIHGTDYDYEYPANDTLVVKLLTDGSYKMNYMSTTESSGGETGTEVVGGNSVSFRR